MYFIIILHILQITYLLLLIFDSLVKEDHDKLPSLSKTIILLIIPLSGIFLFFRFLYLNDKKYKK